ncbi:MAG: shikimate dehydrogenase [Emcibacteraceae bacterium]|nr:shikimate dehydrogenase [Emcibacteraceae bacterium]
MTLPRVKIAGVVGDPISHSLSPVLHGYWLKKYDIKGEYEAFHVAPNELPDFIKRLKTNKIEGVNFTVPHKESVMGLVDELDSAAEKIGAVNTVYFTDEGKLLGSNTDGYGFIKNLKQSITNWISTNKVAVIIGAGGAARAATVSLLDDGIDEIRLINRTHSRAVALSEEIGDKRIKAILWDDYEQALLGADLLVNVTTLGMTGQPELVLNINNLPIGAVVYDIVYNPLETDLLKRARERGNKTVDGLGMLLHQAAPGFKAWFGIFPEVDDDLRHHLIKALA